jgi:hypothetical protein
MSHDGSGTTARTPTGQEFALLARLVGSPFEGASALARQLATTLVAPLDENGSLRLQPGDAVPAVVNRRIPVEASYPDADGVVVHVLLHVVDGRLNELEVYREDSGRVLVPSTETRALEVDLW